MAKKNSRDLFYYYKARQSTFIKVKDFVKKRGIELTIAIVGLLVGIATVLVSNKVGNHQEILQASRATDSYFNGITDLFAKTIDENQRINLIIIARTEAIIDDLNKLKKPDKLASIITFISNLNPKLFNKDTEAQPPREKYVSLTNINIANTILHNIDLSYARLSNSNLRRCNLAHTDLSHAFLKKTNLEAANLNHANLSYANFQGANLRKASVYQTNFEGANLEGAIWINGIKCKKGSIGHCVY